MLLCFLVRFRHVFAHTIAVNSKLSNAHVFWLGLRSYHSAVVYVFGDLEIDLQDKLKLESVFDLI